MCCICSGKSFCDELLGITCCDWLAQEWFDSFHAMIRYNVGERPNRSGFPLLGTHIEQQASAHTTMHRKVPDEEATHA